MFGHQQRGDQIAAECDGNDKTENGIEHDSPSNPVERSGIEHEHEQASDTERQISKIKHDNLHPDWVWRECATNGRQGSIANVGRGYKESVKTVGLPRAKRV